MKKTFVLLGMAAALYGCTVQSGEAPCVGNDGQEPTNTAGRGAEERTPEAPEENATEPGSEFARAECGSLAVSEATASAVRGNAQTLSLKQLVSARIDPDAPGNSEHYWRAELPAGAYHLVVDTNASSGESSNMGLSVQLLDEMGTEVRTLFSGNHVARRAREHASFEVTSARVLHFKVQPRFGMEDYVLGLFATGDAVPSPYFTNCPSITPLALEERATFGAPPVLLTPRR